MLLRKQFRCKSQKPWDSVPWIGVPNMTLIISDKVSCEFLSTKACKKTLRITITLHHGATEEKFYNKSEVNINLI
jgi:hypothetical protein